MYERVTGNRISSKSSSQQGELQCDYDA